MKTQKILKNLLFGVLLIILMFQCTGFTVQAQESVQAPEDTIEVIDLGGGYSIEILPKKLNNTLKSSSLYVYSKTANIKKDNDIIFVYEMKAEFVVNYGVSVRCDKATGKPYAINNSWSLKNESFSYKNSVSTASATVNGTIVHRILGIQTSSRKFDLTITCDKYGK